MAKPSSRSRLSGKIPQVADIVTFQFEGYE
jgi:hypothetical protein